jgi:hypothetical protein
VHNTQPWRLHVTRDELRIHIDATRHLAVLDPTTRQMIISVGCAVMNARVALACEGLSTTVARFPDPARPDLAAVIRPVDGPVDTALAALDHVVELRQTNRRRFAPDPVPENTVEELEAAAAAEQCLLHVVRNPDQRIAVAVLSQHADDIENLNPAYRAELRAWTADDPHRQDGVPNLTVPHVNGAAHDDVPIRDFDTHGHGGLPARTQSSKDQCLVLVCTAGDGRLDWLRAGEALERVLLEVTRHGFAASPLTQITEVPSTRSSLRRELGLGTYPHVLLRIGRAPITPASRRRRLVDVLTEDH